jgi:outer membrane lipoprotein-sorting protein
LPSLVAKSIDNTDVFTDVEDLLNRVNDIEATQESSIEQETEAEVVVLKADFETLQDKVEALEKFIEVLVDKQSWFLDEVESSSDSLKRIALLTNLDVSNALKELKGEK